MAGPTGPFATALRIRKYSDFRMHGGAVADRGVSGPWGPQFCEALGNGEAQRLPAGGAGSPQVGSEAKPRRQTHFGNNILKIGWKSGILVAVCTNNSDLIRGRSITIIDIYESVHSVRLGGRGRTFPPPRKSTFILNRWQCSIKYATCL